MKRSKWIFAAVAAMVCELQASGGETWLLSKLQTPTADSAETNTIYSYQVYSNDASKLTVKVEDGAVHLIASTIASDGTEGYTANFGLLLPLTPDWDEHDLTGLDSITFEYQNDTRITEALSVSFGSTAYSEAVSKAGTVFSNDIAGSSALSGNTTWKTASVQISDFAPPTWWLDIPDDFPTKAEVLKHVKNLQFAPKTTYLSKEGTQKGTPCTDLCVDPTMKSIAFKIKNIVLHGFGGPQPPVDWNKPGCEESVPHFRLDDFAAGSKNTLGRDWFLFSDFDSTGVSTDFANGSTAATETFNKANAYMAMNAQLNKTVGGAYHKYAGWAAIGTNFGEGGVLNATGLTGIGFLLADLGTNPERIQTIAFKAKMAGVADSAIHRYLLPVADLVAAAEAGKIACIRPSDLAQPSYLSASHKTPFDVSKIEQFSWEAKITDDRSPAIDTATAHIALANVVLYGVDAPVVGVRAQARNKTSVGYAKGNLHLTGFTGATRFDVRRLDGTRVASFEATQRASLVLPRGAYLLTASGSNIHLTHKFAVLKP